MQEIEVKPPAAAVRVPSRRPSLCLSRLAQVHVHVDQPGAKTHKTGGVAGTRRAAGWRGAALAGLVFGDPGRRRSGRS